jgi:hypothetical protein
MERLDGSAWRSRMKGRRPDVLGETAIANYRFIVMVKGPNLHPRRRYRTTNVWTKRDGRWPIVAAQLGFVLDAQQAALSGGTEVAARSADSGGV